MLDLKALRSFCEGFYGYGELEAPHWFISMEEGGGNSEKEVSLRLNAWDTRGRRELEEIHDYHRAIGLDKWFSERPPIQKTWAASIRMLLAMEGHDTDRESVRMYQRDQLARRGGAIRLSPLFPLPSKSIAEWNYSAWSTSTRLSDRAAYKQNLELERVEHLRHQISQHAPRTVTFFGASYMKYWESIANINLQLSAEGFRIGRMGRTKLIVCNHPATQGIQNEYFIVAAHALRAA